ncbi:hypothetical protein TIFTF001_027459 [Ficus carica]|uniref:Uncharacterized protein n=1 Tax=Ficus carica TaxID=3494 RepID=A0AA88DN75_FICCA|nr:hypothetical protein TIFTF001_027459 [Ficus carica]
MSVDEIYHRISDRDYLSRLEPLRSNPTKRNQSKYCRFHGECDHQMVECVDLKDEIERLIRNEHLQEYSADRQGGDRRRHKRRDDRRRDENPPEPVTLIRMIFGGPNLGGDSKWSQTNYAREERCARRQGDHRDNIIPEGMIKLPFPVGNRPHTSTVRGNQYESRLTYYDAVDTSPTCVVFHPPQR